MYIFILRGSTVKLWYGGKLLATEITRSPTQNGWEHEWLENLTRSNVKLPDRFVLLG